ncbi:hypothetical protein U1Q18_042144 [Sarracenia purpurea var. burkii]
MGENVSLENSSLVAHPINICTGEGGWLIPPESTNVDSNPLSKCGDPVGPEIYKIQGSLGRRPNSDNDPGSPKHLSPSDPNYEPNPVGNKPNSSPLSCKRRDTLKAPTRAHSWKRRARELKESPKHCPTPVTKEKKKRKGSVDQLIGVNQEDPILEKKQRFDNGAQGMYPLNQTAVAVP